jgi:CRP/FNR family cyclic AMP-dependent transcriptional regulator
MNEQDLKTRFDPYFDAMSATDRGHIVDALVVQHVPAETRLMTQDEPNDRVYFLASGDVAIHVDCPRATLKLGGRGPGSWVGELGFIEPGPASASVDAATDVEAWVLTHEAFERMRRERPAAAAALTEMVCRDIAKRLRNTDALSFERAGEKIAIALHVEDEKAEGLLDKLKHLLGMGGSR